MDLYYVNSRNEKIDFYHRPYLVKNIDQLADYSWDYEGEKSRIKYFSRGVCEIPFSINIFADTEEEYHRACDELFAIVEYDILTNKRGKLFYGNQYIACNLIESKKEDWNKGIPFRILNISVVTDFPYWIAENNYTFQSYGISSSNNKRYPGRYPYRYANGLNSSYIINEHFYDANFMMVVYGPVINPQVAIGGQSYLVNIVLEAGEYLEIDSRAGTVTKVMINGTRINAFHNRRKGGGFFKKVPPGRQVISWTGKFDFDLILYEERSEPRCSN